MGWLDLDEYNKTVEEAEECLVVSAVMLTAGIFVFSVSAMLMPLISIGQSPVSGDYLVLSASIITAAVLLSSVNVISS